MRTSRGGFGGMLLAGVFLAAGGWMRTAAGEDDIDQLLQLENSLTETREDVQAASPMPDAVTETNSTAQATETPEAAPAPEPAAGSEQAEAAKPVEPAAVEPPPGQGEAIGEAVTAIQWLKASNADLQEALAAKEQMLKEASAEIAHMKEVIGKIWETSKREKVNSLYNMGCAYKACRLYKDAEKQFLKALEIDPSDAGVHYNLAILYDDDLKNKASARKHYERFLDLAPNDKDAPRAREWLLSAQTAR